MDEQETTINMYPASVSKTAEVYTCIPAMMQRLINLQKEYPSDVAIVDGDGYIDATVPRDWIKVQPKRKCNMTDEQRKKAADRLNAAKKKVVQT
jgi:hypothetical protein